MNQTDTGISHFGFYSLSIVGRKKDGEVVKDDEKGRPFRLFRYSSFLQNSQPTVYRRKEKRKTVFGPLTIRAFY